MGKEAPEFSEIIQYWKEKYFYHLSLKLKSPQTSTKTHCSIIKSSYNSRKIQIISVNGKICKNFKEKASILQRQNYHLLISKMKVYTK